MKLLPNWRDLATRAWSLRLIEITPIADLVVDVGSFVSSWRP